MDDDELDEVYELILGRIEFDILMSAAVPYPQAAIDKLNDELRGVEVDIDAPLDPADE